MTDPIEHKSRTKDNPENWAYHGINTEGFKGATKKEPTDRPPEDLNQADLPMNQAKLPPQIIEHDDKGNTTDKHSGNDQRYDNHQLQGVQDESLNKQTPMSVNSETSQDPARQQEAEAKRNPPQQNMDTSQTPNSTSVTTQAPAATVAPNTSAGASSTPTTPASSTTTTTTKPVDPNLTVR